MNAIPIIIAINVITFILFLALVLTIKHFIDENNK
jgi:hypothetical protein